MALIKCPECGKEISDKSEVCIHCGYPIKTTDTKSIINGIEYDLDFMFDDKIDAKEKMITLRKIIPGTFSDTVRIFNEIKESGTIPKVINIKTAESNKNNNQIKCPTCQSTDVVRISTTAKVTNAVVFGLLGNKRRKTFHCNNCGYEW